MRPIRLELEGFTAFREATEVDFSDLDFFAIVGPTGSGKSSIIDAICFALYGSVPRYDHEGLVYPVITQGQLEARVRFDFAIDEQAYTAVRIVRRQGQRATTKEARLERGEEVLAGTADELTAQVLSLIGLTFKQFTTCVVLPQGEFSRFLRQEPRKRGDLLVRLLDLGIYEEMAKRANRLAEEAETKILLLEQRVDEELAFATEERLKEAKQTVKSRKRLREQFEKAVPQLSAFEREARGWAEKAEEAENCVAILETLIPPDDAVALSREFENQQKELKYAEHKAKEAAAKARSARAARSALPNRQGVAAVLSDHERRDYLGSQIKKVESEFKVLQKAAREARRECERRQTDLKQAEAALELARHQHQAHALAHGLRSGDLCPVCRRIVKRLPELAAAPDLDAATAAAEEKESLLRIARELLEAAAGRERGQEGKLQHLLGEVTDLDGRLEGHPEKTAVRKMLTAIDVAESEQEAARQVEEEMREHIEKAKDALEATRGLLEDARRSFDQQRDRCAVLSPPSPSRLSLEADWKDLAGWASQEAVRQRELAASCRAKATQSMAHHQRLLDELSEACRREEIKASPPAFLEAVLKALAIAEQEEENIQTALKTRAQLEKQLSETKIDHEVARKLGHHLSARGFEKWILNEALLRLTEGASEILQDLSQNRYSLTVDSNGEFVVVDHENADEQRLASTLSGGETFLASLSLSLTLAEHIAQMAATTAPQLDAIFLDEGFGTLDDQTLSTVAGTIELLGTRGRMVGIITHRPELAERIPVRFEVRKGSRTATVQRVMT